MKPTQSILALSATAFAASLVSCANISHAVVYQHSNFGLNVGTNPATQNVHVRVGIRNEFAIITPKIKAEDGTKKAASSYVATRFRVHDIYSVPEVAEIVATGKAATDIGASKGSAAFLGE
jgi:hypothetical protein